MGLSKVTFKDEHKNGGIVNVSYKPDEYEVTKPETEVSESNGGRELSSGGVADREIKVEHRHIREEKREKEEKEESEEELPDGGWGWVITFGCITIAVIFLLDHMINLFQSTNIFCVPLINYCCVNQIFDRLNYSNLLEFQKQPSMFNFFYRNKQRNKLMNQ